MGEMADYMINGDDCQSCGQYIGDGDGYSRNCKGCERNNEEDLKEISNANYEIYNAIIWLEIAKESLILEKNHTKAKKITGIIKNMEIFKNSL